VIASSRVPKTETSAATGLISHLSPHLTLARKSTVSSSYLLSHSSCINQLCLAHLFRSRRLSTSQPHPLTGIFSDTIRTPKAPPQPGHAIARRPQPLVRTFLRKTILKFPPTIYPAQVPRRYLLFLASSRLVWFRSLYRPHCSLYSPFLIHNLHHIGRLPATLHSSHHPETLIAKSKGLPGIHRNQGPRLIKQLSPRRNYGDLHRAVSPIRTTAVELSGARLPADTISANCPGITAQNFAEPACP
jgi:hypothetical protein